MAVDLLRSHHVCRARMVAGDGRVFWVRWYPCKPGALALPFDTCFGSAVWEDDLDDEGDWPGMLHQPLEWRPKAYPAPPGTHWHGEPAWFLDGVPPEVLSQEPREERCGQPVMDCRGGLAWGGTAWPGEPALLGGGVDAAAGGVLAGGVDAAAGGVLAGGDVPAGEGIVVPCWPDPIPAVLQAEKIAAAGIAPWVPALQTLTWEEGFSDWRSPAWGASEPCIGADVAVSSVRCNVGGNLEWGVTVTALLAGGSTVVSYTADPFELVLGVATTSLGELSCGGGGSFQIRLTASP